MGKGGRKGKGRKGGGKGKKGGGKGKGSKGGGKMSRFAQKLVGVNRVRDAGGRLSQKPRGIGTRPQRASKGYAVRPAERPAMKQSLRSDMYSVLREDEKGPFLRPKPRRLVSVPTQFDSVSEYCATLAHNLLAEFWCVYKEGRGASLEGVAQTGGIRLTGAVEDSLIQHMFIINRSPAIVTGQQLLPGGGVFVTLKPAPQARGYVRIQTLGYIGSYLTEFASILALADSGGRGNLVQNILKPQLKMPGDYADMPLRTAEVPINGSQRSAVAGLQCALEKIQGPPGTGKSTTIFHIIASRVPAGKKVLVTCSRNVAVESITQKVAAVDHGKLLVFGNAARIGPTARDHLLEHESSRSDEFRSFEQLRKCAAHGEKVLSKAIREQEERFPCGFASSGLWRRAMKAFLRKKYSAQYAMRDWCERMSLACGLQEEKVQEKAKLGVLKAARIILCTIASTPRLMRDWDELMPNEPLEVHTIIVDECGCTAESSTPMLLKLQPKNLILVGDHRQLPPCSLVPPTELKGTGHDRSLLERAVLQSGQVHVLKEQYRMHADCAKVVSKLFYGGVLSTPSMVAKERKSRGEPALLWLQMNEWESMPPGTKSYYNPGQAAAALSAAVLLRERHPEATVAILTFYRGQMVYLCKETPAALGVDVLTVDACQGCEYDYVVLTTVRCNARRIVGFVRDKQRCCVAISRAKRQLVIIADQQTLCGEDDWWQVHNACHSASRQEWCKHSIPADMKGTPSVYDKQQEVRVEQLQALQDNMLTEQKGKGGSKGGDRDRGKGDRGKGGKKGGRKGTRNVYDVSRSFEENLPPAEPYMPRDFDADFPTLDGFGTSVTLANSREPTTVGAYTYVSRPAKSSAAKSSASAAPKKLSQKQQKQLREMEEAQKAYASGTSWQRDSDYDEYDQYDHEEVLREESKRSSEEPDEGEWQLGAMDEQMLIEMFGDKCMVKDAVADHDGNCKEAFNVLLERQAQKDRDVRDEEDDLDYDYAGSILFCFVFQY